MNFRAERMKAPDFLSAKPPFPVFGKNGLELTKFFARHADRGSCDSKSSN